MAIRERTRKRNEQAGNRAALKAVMKKSKTKRQRKRKSRVRAMETDSEESGILPVASALQLAPRSASDLVDPFMPLRMVVQPIDVAIKSVGRLPAARPSLKESFGDDAAIHIQPISAGTASVL